MENLLVHLVAFFNVLEQYRTPSILIQVFGLILLICIYRRQTTILIRPRIHRRNKRVQFRRDTAKEEVIVQDDAIVAKWKNIAIILRPIMGGILRSQPVRNAIGSARDDSILGLLKVLLNERGRRQS